MGKILYNNRGLSLIELVVTMVILTILASVVLPSARMTTVRMKEIELKRNLREIRNAIDEYKRTYERGVAEGKIQVVINKPQGYPETLEVLVEGHDFGGYLMYKKKFLRRIPRDPMYQAPDGATRGEDLWGLRSHEDEPDSENWGGENVFDVYSKSQAKAIDGTYYKDW